MPTLALLKTIYKGKTRKWLGAGYIKAITRPYGTTDFWHIELLDGTVWNSGANFVAQIDGVYGKFTRI